MARTYGLNAADQAILESFHPSHRIRISVFGGAFIDCQLCKAEGCIGDENDNSEALIAPCPVSESARQEFDRTTLQKKLVMADRRPIDIGFNEVSDAMLPAFLEQIENCNQTLFILELVVCVTGSRQYAGRKLYGVVVTIPTNQSSKDINVRRWFEGGTWS